MESLAAIFLGLVITFTCGDTLRRTVQIFRQDTGRVPWQQLLVGLLGFGVGAALLVAGILST
ncbi:MAG: hypothetical protein GVY35_17505 [Bacteroidetes bacterium]|jgi:hypothetical protein|nr:hypothetical protein [Bacteroidota bacterium]